MSQSPHDTRRPSTSSGVTSPFSWHSISQPTISHTASESIPYWFSVRFISSANGRLRLPMREVKPHSVSNSGPSASIPSQT